MRAFFSGKKTEKAKTPAKPDEKPKDAEKPKVEAKKPNAAAETKTATPDKSKTPAKQTTSTAPAKTLNPKNSGSDADEKVEGNANGLNGSKGSPTLSGATGSALPLPLQRRLSKSELLKPVASFQDTPATGRQTLFIQKLRLCTIMFEWGDDANQKDNRAKEVKRQQLLELVEYIGKNKGIFTDPVLAELMNMVRTNFFRPLPPKREEHPSPGSEGKPAGAAGAGEGEEEDPVFEPSWPHLQIVYEFFLRFIVSSEVDVRTLKRHINGQFVLKLLELFDSEDHRERDYLKTILHRIYAKFMSLRAFIRKAINNVFYSFIYDTETHNGVAELLEILGSIINGFALPLKQEHKTFLKKVLTPMHKVRNLNTFHQQLAYCVTQFVDKDPHLAVPVLSGLLKYWPVTNSAKEVLFLNELEELLELTQPDEFKAVLVPLFTQLNKSIGSPHFQVAERVLFLWHNEYVSGLIADHRVQILPVIFPSLHANSQGHWNPTVHNLTLNVLKIFMDLDANLVEECQKKYLEMKEREPDQKTLQARWERMEAAIPPDVWNGYQAELSAREREREAAALAERNRYFSPGYLGNATSSSSSTTTNASSGILDAGGKESKDQKDGAASSGA